MRHQDDSDHGDDLGDWYLIGAIALLVALIIWVPLLGWLR
jgi:hypothetical protein